MARKASPAGRRGALDEARELVALVASLSEAGDALSAEAVAAKLGTTTERAEKLVGLVLTASLGDGARLPLVEEDGEVTLLFSEGVRGRRLRLTRSETVAVAAALKRLGVPEADPLRAKIDSSLADGALDQQVVERAMAPSAHEAQADALRICAQARTQGRELAFDYRKLSGSAAEKRRVMARALRYESDAWYLDAWDLDRDGERTFRVDRMGALELGERREARARLEAAPADTRLVDVTFTEPSYLDLLGLRAHLLHAQADEKGTVHAKVAYYGGDWLVRMLAACGNSVTIADPELAAQVRTYARGLLTQQR